MKDLVLRINKVNKNVISEIRGFMSKIEEN